jgi:hypothetical protein
VGLSAAKLSRRLLAELEQIDDGRLPIAEVNRRLGATADRLGLRRPSYERVRTVVHELRRRRAEPTALNIFVVISTRARPPDAMLDHLAGIRAPNLP